MHPRSNDLLRHEHLRDFVIGDAQVQESLQLVTAAVRLQAPILIRGESGIGKEMVARHGHAVSGRRFAFVAVNCTALPVELFEAELFGYVGGAYTGARREGDVGLIVSADGGTLLLDEIRELGPTAQAALLRFLDGQQERPVGGHSLRRVDVQLLAATHADLEAEVAARRFRADLFYRLHTVAVSLPPLRQRTDLHEVLDHTLERLERQATLSLRALARLAQERWPGNFRELRAVLTRALLRCSHQHIDIDDVLRVLGPGASTATRILPTAAAARQPAAGTGLPDVQWGNSYALPPAVHTRVTPTRRARPQHPSAPSALQQSATLAVLDEYARNGGIA